MTPDDLDYVLRRPTEASFAFVKREESITFLLSHISHCLFSRVCLLGIHVFTHARAGPEPYCSTKMSAFSGIEFSLIHYMLISVDPLLSIHHPFEKGKRPLVNTSR